MRCHDILLSIASSMQLQLNWGLVCVQCTVCIWVPQSCWMQDSFGGSVRNVVIKNHNYIHTYRDYPTNTATAVKKEI